MTWYRIEAPAPGPCGGIEFNAENRAIHGAPIFRWMRGKTLAFVQQWCASKRWKIEILERSA